MKNPRLLKKTCLWIIAISCLLSVNKANATHVAGADLTYENLGGTSYRVTLTYYRDCAGAMPIQTEDLRIQSATCGQDFVVQLVVLPGTGDEITFPCNSSTSTCSGGSSFGVQKWSYSAVVQLPGNCADWVFSWNRCCRNCAITTTIHGNCQTDPQSVIYVEATLNNLDVTGNNSPTFSNDPVATMCAGQSFIYNHGVTDVDGDSLAYNIVGSQVAPGTAVTYQPGYSALNPINSVPALSINAAGDLTMTPQQIETGVMAVKVDEYRGGILIGSVTRDMQFIVQTCNNTLPTASGINGTADFDTTLCPGSQICFYIFTNDADAQQSLTLTSNNVIPGAVFNNSGGAHPTGSFCWTPTAADARSTPWTFTVTVKDDACPTNGLQTYSFSITVPEILPSTIADDVTGDIDLTVAGNTGPYTYAWSTGDITEDLSGQAPGIYTVTVCDVNGCCVNTQDTIHQLGGCSFPVHTTRHLITCYNACDGSITLTPQGGTPPYNYVWSNGATTGNIVSNLCAGTYYYTVYDANGCSWTCHTVFYNPSQLNVSCTGTNTCIGACLGSASVTVTGGKAPYSYLWNNGSTATSLSDLCCGTYTVIVTDNNGCSDSCEVTVTQFQALVLTTHITNATSSQSCDGKFSASVSGGTPGYDFLWSTGAASSGIANDSITALCPGSYSVTVTDANGCTRKTAKTVGPIAVRGFDGHAAANHARTMDDNDMAFKATAVPNPFSNDFMIETGNDDAVQVRIYSMSGSLVQAYDNIYPNQRIGGELSSGLYLVEMMQNDNTVYQRLAKQNQ